MGFMEKNSDTLRQVGEDLYGAHWPGQLAAALQVDERTMRRWVAGAPIPAGIWTDLGDLCVKRAKDLTRWGIEFGRMR